MKQMYFIEWSNDLKEFVITQVSIVLTSNWTILAHHEEKVVWYFAPLYIGTLEDCEKVKLEMEKIHGGIKEFTHFAPSWTMPDEGEDDGEGCCGGCEDCRGWNSGDSEECEVNEPEPQNKVDLWLIGT